MIVEIRHLKGRELPEMLQVTGKILPRIRAKRTSIIVLSYCQRMARVTVATFGTNHGLALATELAVAVLKVI